jgi:hypothetical protein
MEHSTPETDTSLAAYAFGELRAEVSLLRRAVERLTDERVNQPDYAPSLEAISKRLEQVCDVTRQLAQRPALRLTPEVIGREISEAGTFSREQDRKMMQEARARMDATAGRIDAAMARERSAAEQDRVLLYNRIACAVAGMVTFSILPGVVARSLPASWAVPERLAARTVGKDMWHAGQQMMDKAQPGQQR